MATNEIEEPGPSRDEQIRAIFGTVTQTVTGAPDTELPLRVFLALMVVAICMVWSPWPLNAIGILATLVLALSIPTRRRR